MPRPSGFSLNAQAWEDVLRLTGLSLTQVAERSGVPRPTISSLLGGHHKASVPMAHRVASAVGVHAETLFPDLRPRVAEVA